MSSKYFLFISKVLIYEENVFRQSLFHYLHYLQVTEKGFSSIRKKKTFPLILKSSLRIKTRFCLKNFNNLFNN